MFFTRLAIAALSFGSAAKVFAAPIAIGVSLPPSVDVAIAAPVERRLDLTLSGVLNIATGVVGTAKGKIDSLVKDPAGTLNAELVSAVAQIAPALKPITEQLKAAGVDQDVLMLDVDGVTKLTSDVMAADFTDLLSLVGDIMSTVKGLHSLSLVQSELESVKAELIEIQTVLGAVLPEVSALLDSVLSDVIGVVDGVLNIVLGIAGSLLGGIAPSA